MISKFDFLLMVKVAQMHYMNNMEQEEIAEELNISSSFISKILDEAVKFGIVEIKIRSAV